MKDLSGQIVRDYELIERIGAGGFGVVYRAHQPSVKREVAVKMILPEFAEHPDFIKRFETEAQLVARLEHPYIIPLHDYWRDDEGAFLVMRWLKGGNLRECLHDGPLQLPELARLLDQIGEALAFAHDHDVIHRDLKPENILLDEAENAYLTDFGIAKDLSVPGVTETGKIMGSVDYMSPEQAKGEPITPQTDIYALGVLLYELLICEHPFPDSTPIQMIQKQLNEPLPLVADKRPDLPPWVDGVIERATAKVSVDRYPDVEALLADFRQAMVTPEGHAFYDELSKGEGLPGKMTTTPWHNLPTLQTSFIGRGGELAEINERLSEPDCRLLTLVGPGGVGKTRLALEAARAGLQSYPDGACFVALESIATSEYLVPTIADALEFSFDTHSSDLDPKTQLLDYLRQRSVLMVMDNFEHLVESSDLLAEILEQAPEIMLLVTSRERLNLQGEWAMDVSGLAYPENGDAGQAENFSAFELFEKRARQTYSGFSLNGKVLPHVNRISQLVEGMPLAIELAASWVSMLSCEEIAHEIERSIDFLATSMRDLPKKHRSVRAAFEHSWNLLEEDKREAFRRLAVFMGGFTRDAALEVAGVDLAILSDFSGKSLLRRSQSGRFELHALIRQFAGEKLAEDAAAEQAALDRHSDYYIGFLADRADSLRDEQLKQTLAEVREEIDNLRVASRRALTQWDESRARNAIHNLFIFYLVHGWHEGRDAFDELSQAVKDSPKSTNPVYVSTRLRQAMFEANLGHTSPAEAIALECLPAVDELGLEQDKSLALFILGTIAAYQGEYEQAKDHYKEALDLSRAREDAEQVPTLLLWLGWVRYQLGDREGANKNFAESLELFEATRNLWGKAFALSKLGLGADAGKEYELAMQYHLEGRMIFERFGDIAGVAYTTSRMSMAAYGLGDYAAAWRYGKEGKNAFGEIGHRWGISTSLCRMGFASVGSGDLRKAWECFQEALSCAQEEETIPLVLYAIIGMACVLVAAGELDRGVALLATAKAHEKTPTIYMDLAERWFEGVEDKLGTESHAEATAQGESQDLKEVIEELLQTESFPANSITM